MKALQATATITAGSETIRASNAPLLGQGALSDLQRSGGNQAFVRLMSLPRIQAKAEDHGGIDRQVASVSSAEPLSDVAVEPAAEKDTPPAKADAGAAPAFVVEDHDRTLGPGQLTRTVFLARVREAANKGFAGTDRTADDCPWIEHWLGRYELRDAMYLNCSLTKLAPETARAPTADDAVVMIAARVRCSVDAYVKTGELTSVPECISPEIPGMNLVGALLGSIRRKALPGRSAPSSRLPNGNSRSAGGQGTPGCGPAAAFERAVAHGRSVRRELFGRADA